MSDGCNGMNRRLLASSEARYSLNSRSLGRGVSVLRYVLVIHNTELKSGINRAEYSLHDKVRVMAMKVRIDRQVYHLGCCDRCTGAVVHVVRACVGEAKCQVEASPHAFPVEVDFRDVSHSNGKSNQCGFRFLRKDGQFNARDASQLFQVGCRDIAPPADDIVNACRQGRSQPDLPRPHMAIARCLPHFLTLAVIRRSTICI